MKLVLKLPPGKAPFIGVLFENESEARKVNAGWINNYHTHLYQVIFEPIGDRINVILKEEKMNFNHVYEGLKYSPEKLLQFLTLTKLSKNFNFAHLIMDGDKHAVVRSITNQRLFVFKIEKLKVMYEH